MGKNITLLLKIAASQIGNTEFPAESNKTAYGIEYGWNGVPWCVIFGWWCHYYAGLNKIWYDGKKTASCGQFASWAKKKGYIVSGDPKPGDTIIFSFRKNADGSPETSHYGICESYSNGKITCIEGNTSFDSKGSQYNGGCVARKTRAKSKILYAIRMPLDNDFSEGTYTVRKGDSLYAISKKVYGNGSLWRKISDANNLKSTVIYPGQILRIPEV